MSNFSKKAVIYCRNASAEQSVSDLARQETECRLYAAKHGYEVAQAFHDDGHSGLTMHRPAFRLMLVSLLAMPEPCAVIVTAMDRISRDVNDFASICKIVGALDGELLFTEDEASGRSA